MNEENKNMNQENTEEPRQEMPVEEIPAKETPVEEIPNTLQSDSNEKSTSGPVVGIAIIIIVLIAGGIYFWNTAVDRGDEGESSAVTQSEEAADEIVSQLSTQGTSDEIVDIEADLDTTELDELDAELDDLLNEL